MKKTLQKVWLSKPPEVKALFHSFPSLVANQLQLLVFPFPVAIDGARSDGIEPGQKVNMLLDVSF